MKQILVAISILSLAVLILTTILYFNGQIEFSTNKSWILIGTIGWFATAPFWMRQKSS